MIFNSISKQLSRNSYAKPTNYKSSQQEHYFPVNEPIYPRASEPTKSAHFETNTALSKMNQKIVDNIEYIRYKDKLRTSELKSSRISCSSNRSNRSNHSASKLTHTNSSKHSFPVTSSGVRFEAPQHYFPQASNLTSSNDKWRSQIKANNFERSYSQNYENEEFKQFARKPITIETTNHNLSNVYSDHHQKSRAEKDFHQELLLSKHSKSSSFEEFRGEKTNSPFIPSNFEATPVNREWSNSFASNSQPIKTAQPIKIEEEHRSSVKTEPAPQRQLSQQSLMSPLPHDKKTRRDGIIVAAVLIALGLMLLLLQILK